MSELTEWRSVLKPSEALKRGNLVGVTCECGGVIVVKRRDGMCGHPGFRDTMLHVPEHAFIRMAKETPWSRRIGAVGAIIMSRVEARRAGCAVAKCKFDDCPRCGGRVAVGQGQEHEPAQCDEIRIALEFERRDFLPISRRVGDAIEAAGAKVESSPGNQLFAPRATVRAWRLLGVFSTCSRQWRHRALRALAANPDAIEAADAVAALNGDVRKYLWSIVSSSEEAGDGGSS